MVIFALVFGLQEAGVVVVAVIAAAAADDDVVNQLDVHDLAGLVDALGEAVVLGAGVGIVAGMVVSQDDARREALDGGAQDHLDVGNGHGGATAAHLHTFLDLFGVVKQDDQHFLMVEVLHLSTQVFVGFVAAGNLEAIFKFLLLVAARQFQGSEDFNGFDLADAVVILHEVVDALAGNEIEFVVVVAQDALAQVNDRLTWGAHTKQDGEQFGSGQAVKAVLLGFLARTVLLGDRLLDVAGHCLLSIFFLFYHGGNGFNGDNGTCLMPIFLCASALPR